MRLIDANKLKEDVLDLPNCPNEFSDTYDKARILDLVDEQSAVDAEPVRHEHWKEHKDYPGLAYLCSGCGYFTTDRSYYCPHCGAKMDGGRR